MELHNEQKKMSKLILSKLNLYSVRSVHHNLLRCILILDIITLIRNWCGETDRGLWTDAAENGTGQIEQRPSDLCSKLFLSL